MNFELKTLQFALIMLKKYWKMFQFWKDSSQAPKSHPVKTLKREGVKEGGKEKGGGWGEHRQPVKKEKSGAVWVLGRSEKIQALGMPERVLICWQLKSHWGSPQDIKCTSQYGNGALAMWSWQLGNGPVLPRYIQKSRYEPGYACSHIWKLVLFKYPSLYVSGIMCSCSNQPSCFMHMA